MQIGWMRCLLPSVYKTSRGKNPNKAPKPNCCNTIGLLELCKSVLRTEWLVSYYQLTEQCEFLPITWVWTHFMLLVCKRSIVCCWCQECDQTTCVGECRGQHYLFSPAKGTCVNLGLLERKRRFMNLVPRMNYRAVMFSCRCVRC